MALREKFWQVMMRGFTSHWRAIILIPTRSQNIRNVFGVIALVRKSLNNKKLQSIKVTDIDIALQMIKRHMNASDIKALLSSLETLRTDPQNETYQEQVTKAFNELGPLQGAALTYAPYLNIFVSDDPFGNWS